LDHTQQVIILLCNDDGIEAEGLAALRRAASQLFPEARIFTVAPATGMSQVGHRVTTHEPIPVTRLGERDWAVTGTPADCVRVALAHLLQVRPDWVFSGINHGGNLGQDIYISGTVAAAREAARSAARLAARQHQKRARKAKNVRRTGERGTGSEFGTGVEVEAVLLCLLVWSICAIKPPV
jgi:5'-nucleotidase